MSENLKHLNVAMKLLSEMITLVTVFEAGTTSPAPGFEIDLSPTNIAQLKSMFVSARTQLKNEVDSVTANGE